MGNNNANRAKLFGRLMTLALGMSILIFLPVMASAQSGGGDSLRAHRASKSFRRVNQARVNAAQIKRLKEIPGVESVLTFQGNIIKPRKGRSIWALDRSSYLILGNQPPSVYAEEIKEVLPDGSIQYVVCHCPGSRGSDPCQFAVRNNWSSLCVNATCCSKTFFVVDSAGTAQERN